VADWVDQADDKDRRLALEALQVSISATKGAATMSGVLPTDTPGFITDEQSSRCSFNGEYGQPKYRGFYILNSIRIVI